MADGTEIGCRHDLHLGSWWLEVRAEDYLSRGNSELGFYGKLKLFLTEQVCDRTCSRERSLPFFNTNICSVLTMPTGLTHTSSQHHAF
jgi:hypothetical protein